MSGDVAAALREPWDSLRRQREAAEFGVWIFLGSEALLFAGLLLAFAVNRTLHPAGFAASGRETDIVFGTVNTLVLLTSSLAMAVGSEAARAGLRRLALRALATVLLLGLTFLVLKGFEWAKDLREQLWPGAGFRLAEPGARLFFGLYWTMTALHALHLAGGLAVVGWLSWQGWRGTRPLGSPAFQVAALYWHLVDVVWILLYPLLYLGGRA
ncbi:cytochrome c oxidase subunit 3 [Roseomonas sp. NAR14]|uniref:Cytochrome c oxidase subunit 3 n=1 Tax=Roseomonas acroporae TaxID=2937791 RepID=A0A9X2BVW8_9PROT|nr:cytochrome c oxidase subunit 3 [Roseomonas acroporae]MCK8787078.1 cytochrome c oxidase subunit 3 [Roseomonas acroporae]